MARRSRLVGRPAPTRRRSLADSAGAAGAGSTHAIAVPASWLITVADAPGASQEQGTHETERNPLIALHFSAPCATRTGRPDEMLFAGWRAALVPGGSHPSFGGRGRKDQPGPKGGFRFTPRFRGPARSTVPSAKGNFGRKGKLLKRFLRISTLVPYTDRSRMSFRSLPAKSLSSP